MICINKNSKSLFHLSIARSDVMQMVFKKHFTASDVRFFSVPILCCLSIAYSLALSLNGIPPFCRVILQLSELVILFIRKFSKESINKTDGWIYFVCTREKSNLSKIECIQLVYCQIKKHDFMSKDLKAC